MILNLIPLFIGNVTLLSLTSGQTRNICPKTLEEIIRSSSSITELDFTDNKISQLPPILATSKNKLKRLWLQGNPFICSCNMTWLSRWLVNEGRRIVQDYQKVICNHGKEIGRPIYLLDKAEMNCIPESSGTGIAMGIVGGVMGLSLFCLGLVVRYQNMRWFVYRAFGKFWGDPDKNEDTSTLQYDAFLSFW